MEDNTYPPTWDDARHDDGKLLFELSRDLICVAGFDGYLKRVNPAWTRCLGWTAEELTSRPSIEFVHPDDREATLGKRAGILKGTPLQDFENRYLCKDGSERWLSWTSSPAMERGAVLCIARDVTRRREWERHVAQINRMETVGTLAAGVAHNLNNALTPVAMTLDMLQQFETRPSTAAMIANSIKSLERAIGIIQRLSEFAEGGKLNPSDVRVAALMDALAKRLEDAAPDSIRIVLDIGDVPPVVQGEHSRLEQAMLELGVNALDAMEDGGTLTLRAFRIHVGPTDAPACPEASPGDYVALEVSDTGTGMDPERQRKIFEPFFTTKETGKGTGLGLSTVHSTIRGHGGFVTVESQPGSGSRFRVHVPA